MYQSNGVKRERSDWRDQALSHRHRDWGYDCPAVDVDFLLIEFHQGEPKALIEYKAEWAQMPNDRALRAMRALANNSKIPLFVVFYNSEHWWFRVVPCNAWARAAVNTITTLSEHQYVALLYRVRGAVFPRALAATLNTYIPPKNY